MKIEKIYEIQKLISRNIIGNIPDRATQAVIREIMFNPKNKINWDQALKSACEHMPELEGLIKE